MLPANRRPTPLNNRRPGGIGSIAKAVLMAVAAIVTLKVMLFVLAVTISLFLTIGMAVVLGVVVLLTYRALRRRG